MKPILFNTDMVRGLQNGTKTATRRLVKPQPKDGFLPTWRENWDSVAGAQPAWVVLPPYHPGDILYVRETFCLNNFGYHYRADWLDDNCPDMSADDKWRPSIHMPREAARIFLRVTDVRVERLQDITYEDCLREGITDDEIDERDAFRPVTSAKWLFARLWNGLIKKADRALYG